MIKTVKKQQKQKQTILFASLALILVVGGYFGGHALGWWGAFADINIPSTTTPTSTTTTTVTVPTAPIQPPTTVDDPPYIPPGPDPNIDPFEFDIPEEDTDPIDTVYNPEDTEDWFYEETTEPETKSNNTWLVVGGVVIVIIASMTISKRKLQ